MPKQAVEKTSEIETVMRTINVKLPKKFEEFLQGVAKIAGVSIEEVLLDALYGVLRSYIQGGHLEAWTEWIIDNRKDLDEEVSKMDY